MATDPAYLARDAGQQSPSDVLRNRAHERVRARRGQPSRNTLRVDSERTAQALGWVSLGLGAAALFAPHALGRITGLRDRELLLRLVGAREILSGGGLLTQPGKTRWLWSRVLGDAMDLALIVTALRTQRRHRGRIFAAAGVVAAIAAADVAASARHTMAHGWQRRLRDAYLESAIIVNKSPQECYDFWRNLSNLPKFSPMLESVTQVDERRSHWLMRGPLSSALEWDAEITVDKPGERIAWRSVNGSAVEQAGVVRFDPATGSRGTLVRVSMHYKPPAGGAGLTIARIAGADPHSRVREDLRRFRQLIEAGEIPTTRGQPSGRRSLLGRLTREGRLSREGRSQSRGAPQPAGSGSTHEDSVATEGRSS